MSVVNFHPNTEQTNNKLFMPRIYCSLASNILLSLFQQSCFFFGLEMFEHPESSVKIVRLELTSSKNPEEVLRLLSL